MPEHCHASNTKTNSIHLISIYTIDETSREVNLIETPLSISIYIKLQDRKAPDISYKYSCSHKLVIDINIDNIQHDYTNYNKDSNLSKEAEKDMPALSLYKRKCLLNSLLTDSSERRLIETQSVDFSTSNSFTASETIVIGSECSLKMSAGVCS